ncbi:MAG TPA: efflux RND transporter periplasmic adaptor subunit, partial [Gemmatimonadales bacterium]|nr:efflux RND transporter periplasmic adaptor subunit [Gemmatimonadales bacterium]
MSGIFGNQGWRGVAAVASLLLAACGGGDNDAAANELAAEAAVTAVGPENITVVRSQTIATGPAVSGALLPEREATMRAQLSGAIVSVHADEGSRVARGALLARIDDRTLRDQFLGARSGLTTAQSAADIAARELGRNEKLAEAGAIAERDLEGARRANVAAQSQLADAQARLTIAQKQIDDAQVRAPFTGIVSVRSVAAGDVVQPGAALFTVVDPTSMRIEASVPAAQLGAVRVGVPATFTVSGYPDRVFSGKIVRINPTADPTTGQVRVVVSIPNDRATLVGWLFAEGRVQA